jgi:uncharacterized Rmd1/YagE family protein
MRCVGFCTAIAYQLNEISDFYKAKGYISKNYRNVIYLSHPKMRGALFFFANGCFVAWGFRHFQEKQFINEVKYFSIEPLREYESDFFIVRSADRTKLITHDRFNVDVIYLEDEDPEIKLAISYGLALSVKMESYEETIKKEIEKNQPLSIDLAKNGKIKLSRKEISKRLGEIALNKAYVSLSSEYHVPEFFWQNSSLEIYYQMTIRFLDIPVRINSLNQRLDVLNQLMMILTQQLQHRHSSMLEIIIILLIFFELMLTIIHWLTE